MDAMTTPQPSLTQDASNPTSHAIGIQAEEAVIDLLARSGWRVLSWRSRTRWGEIDVVARRGRLITFLEVKAAGPRRVDPGRVVDERAQHRLRRAAVAWISTHESDVRDVQHFRFDVMLVRYGADRSIRSIERIQNAF